MKDNYGNELKVGDVVAWIYTSGKSHEMKVGRILEIRNRFGKERAIMDRIAGIIHKGVEGVSLVKMPDGVDPEQLKRQYEKYHYNWYGDEQQNV